MTKHLVKLTWALLLIPFPTLVAQTRIPPVIEGPSRVFAGPPQLLQESGAGEGPAWHPELGLLTSGDGDIHRRDKQGHSTIYRANAGSNGLLFDRQGRLVICEPVRRRVTRLELNGDLYVAAGLNKPHLPDETAEHPTAGIYVFSPAGEVIDFAPIPRDETTNCGFGGEDLKTLFVTAGGSLWSIRTHHAGKP